MKFTFANTPLLPVAVALGLGIAATYYIGYVASIAVLCILAAACLGWWVWRGSAFGAIIVGFAAVGMLSVYLNDQLRAVELENHTRKEFVARLISEAETHRASTKQNRYLRASAKLIAVRDSGATQWRPVDNVIQLNIDTAACHATPSIGIGATIYFTAKLRPLHGSYGRYLHLQGFDHRAYTYKIKLFARDTTSGERLIMLRNKLAARLDSADRSGVAAALVLGHKQNMDRTVKDEYRASGVSHTLAVSGLHVGIVFAILNLILGFLRLSTAGRYASSIVILILLWIYAALTGFSPSVIRAVVMFSVVQFGIMFSRSATSLNTLSLAWIVILIWNPDTLFDIGFQLSFAAMLAIVTLYPTLTSLLKPKNTVLRWLWQLTAIGITAQIGVMPLIAYYFGQIPLLGILLSPILWFTLPVIITLGFLYLALPYEIIGASLGFFVKIQNATISYASSLNYTINDAHISAAICIVCYIIMFSIMTLINNMSDKFSKPS